MRRDSRNRRNAFTLTELLVVIAIIGILMAFILIAAQDGVHRAQEKATLSLISKLDVAVSERYDALMYRRADVYPAHTLMATITNGSTSLPVDMRAQVIAQIDLVRAQMPDVFFVQGGTNYPINFAGLSNPTVGVINGTVTTGNADNGVPIGTFSNGNTAIATLGAAQAAQFPALGVYGATYQAAAGLYKNLGYLPQGYDGSDNDGNGLVDDLKEGIGSDPLVSDPLNPNSPQIHLSALIQNRLLAHTHNTARSEMLYAILVEGQGPFGSSFTRDDFSSKEVGDTDGDGLPEFIDAWGQPLQFYRWPIYFNTDLSVGVLSPNTNGPVGGGSYIQKGLLPYGTPGATPIPYGDGIGESRQLDPLDPNQTLVSLGWWASGVNSTPASSAAFSADTLQFMGNFYTLIEPYFHNTASPPVGSAWDRSGATARRAFYSRFLIVSSGPDQLLGVAQLNVDYHNSLYTSPALNSGPPLYLPQGSRDTSGALIQFPVMSGGNVNANASTLLLTTIENQAGQIDPNRSGLLQAPLGGAPFGEQETSHYSGFPYNDTSYWIQQSGKDDITNQGLASPGGGVR